MKIGFSYGQCVRDLVEGKVRIDDVMVVICGTRIETREQIDAVIGEYLKRPGYLIGLDAAACKAMAYQLWDHGKIHQPRIYGYARNQVPANCIWADMHPSPVTPNASLEQAWSQYRLLVDLTGDVPKNVAEMWQAL